MHRYGYQGMRVGAVTAAAGVQKGAFYHHFASKRTLAFAVIDEIIALRVVEYWTAVLEDAADPVAAISATLVNTCEKLSRSDLELGCPLCNLAQEMSPIDAQFRQRLGIVFDDWVGRVERALSRGQAGGMVRADIDCARSAAFLVAALQGSIARAKVAQDLGLLRACARELADYLDTLRVPA